MSDSNGRPLKSSMQVFSLDEIVSTLQEMEAPPTAFSPLGFLSSDKYAEFDKKKGEVSLRKRQLSAPTPDGMSFVASYFDALQVVVDPIYSVEIVSVALKTQVLARAFYWGDGQTIVEAHVSEDGFRMSSPMPIESWALAFSKMLLGETNNCHDPLILPKNAYQMCQQFTHSLATVEELSVGGLRAHIQELEALADEQLDAIIAALYGVGILQNKDDEDRSAFGHPIWNCFACDKNIQVMFRDEQGDVGSMSFSGSAGNATQIITPINDDPELLMATWPSPESLRDELMVGLQLVDGD